MTAPRLTCTICGIRRQTNPSRLTGDRCRDCMRAASIPTPGEWAALTGGHWQTGVGGIQRWIPADPALWITHRATAYIWSDETRKRAHAAWTRGERNDWARDGERAYQREKKRTQRQQQREAA